MIFAKNEKSPVKDSHEALENTLNSKKVPAPEAPSTLTATKTWDQWKPESFLTLEMAPLDADGCRGCVGPCCWIADNDFVCPSTSNRHGRRRKP